MSSWLLTVCFSLDMSHVRGRLPYDSSSSQQLVSCKEAAEILHEASERLSCYMPLHPIFCDEIKPPARSAAHPPPLAARRREARRAPSARSAAHPALPGQALIQEDAIALEMKSPKKLSSYLWDSRVPVASCMNTSEFGTVQWSREPFSGDFHDHWLKLFKVFIVHKSRGTLCVPERIKDQALGEQSDSSSYAVRPSGTVSHG